MLQRWLKLDRQMTEIPTKSNGLPQAVLVLPVNHQEQRSGFCHHALCTLCRHSVRTRVSTFSNRSMTSHDTVTGSSHAALRGS
jgi:hypothetical protein